MSCSKQAVYFVLQMNTADLVHEIRLVLSDREASCHRTCYSLQVDGTAIDLFAEIKQYEQIKDGCTIRLVDGELVFCLVWSTITEPGFYLRTVYSSRGTPACSSVPGSAKSVR
jgi:hypothetical protein